MDLTEVKYWARKQQLHTVEIGRIHAKLKADSFTDAERREMLTDLTQSTYYVVRLGQALEDLGRRKKWWQFWRR